VALQPWRALPPDKGIETADRATYLGNDFTRDSYVFAGKPMYRTAVSTTDLFDWPAERDLETARRKFLWFGSDGLVHKGLDLALEAFAAMPDFQLTVCGPIAGEADFAAEYRKELYETANIKTLDWIDIHSEAWLKLARETGAVVYPSCSEGGGGSVITCMHAGMLPVVTREASVDIGDFGVPIAEGTVESVMAAVQCAANLPAPDFEARARAGWEHVRKHHTRESFSAAYREAANRLLQDSGQN
jgi:glycosyltransferase involved in cell wall biosynthesis